MTVKNDWLKKAWIITIVGFIISFFINRLLIVFVVITWYFIYKDAEQRKLSKAHGAWSLLGILGMAIYHLFFARKHKIKK